MDDATRIKILKGFILLLSGFQFFNAWRMKQLWDSFNKISRAGQQMLEMNEILVKLVEETNPSLLSDPRLKTFLVNEEFKDIMINNKLGDL